MTGKGRGPSAGSDDSETATVVHDTISLLMGSGVASEYSRHLQPPAAVDDESMGGDKRATGTEEEDRFGDLFRFAGPFQ